MTDLELIKSKLNIVDVISSYVADVKPAGSNFKARCPFHSEKTASFMINPSLQIFKCFGCGKGGDAIKFIEEIERVTFPDAIKIAAEKAGVDISFNSKDKKLVEEEKKIIEANTLAAKFYNYILKTHKSGKVGRDYAQKRQIDSQRIDDFLVGYAPNSKTNLKKFLTSKGFKEAELLKWGLLVDRDKNLIDKFRYRLLQPIFNMRGDVVGFSGRYVGTSKLAPKYLNSPETLVYRKQDLLYGFFQAKETIRKENFAILVEGNIDILSSHRVEVKNIVAPLGTAFTITQAKLIKRFCEEIYFCFDTDEAGTKALIRGIEIAENAGIKHKVIDLTGYQDADELICKDASEWPKRIKNAQNSLNYLMKKLADGIDLGSLDGKTKYSEKIIPVLKSLKDEIELNHYVKEIAATLEIPDSSVLEKVKQGGSSFRKELQEELKVDAPVSVRKLERYFLSLLIQTDKLEKFKDLSEDYFQDPICKKIYIELRKSGMHSDFGQIANALDEKSKIAFEEIIMYDAGESVFPQKEAENLFNRLRKSYLQAEILKLKKELNNDPENEEILGRLKDYTQRLRD